MILKTNLPGFGDRSDVANEIERGSILEVGAQQMVILFTEVGLGGE